MNAAETRTLTKIRNAGAAGLDVAKVDARHGGRLVRWGLVRIVGDVNKPGAVAVAR